MGVGDTCADAGEMTEILYTCIPCVLTKFNSGLLTRISFRSRKSFKNNDVMYVVRQTDFVPEL